MFARSYCLKKELRLYGLTKGQTVKRDEEETYCQGEEYGLGTATVKMDLVGPTGQGLQSSPIIRRRGNVILALINRHRMGYPHGAYCQSYR